MEILLSAAEQEYLKRHVALAPDTAQFVEYGCGGSTILFAEAMRAEQQLYSIEHNPEWFEKVSTYLQDGLFTNVNLFLRLPCQGKIVVLLNSDGTKTLMPEKLLRPYSTHNEELPLGLEDYIHAVDTGIDWSRVPMVFVDGVARGAVLAVLRQKLNPGTKVLLHDAKGREIWYKWAVDELYVQEELIDNMLVLSVPA